jgi:hypothetical protein
MKKCTYCGKEYGDDASLCSIDGQPLQVFVPPAPVPTTPQSLTMPQSAGRNKLPPQQFAVAGFPLVLLLFGGALGGLCGGAAFALSVRVFKSFHPVGRKYLFSLLISVGAAVLYFGLLVTLIHLFPGIFRRH